MMKNLSAPATIIWLVLSVAACGADPSSPSQPGGSGGSSAGSGGSMAGDSGGSSVMGSGGSSLGAGGSSAVGSGGSSLGAGGSSVVGSGGSSLGAGGSSVVGSGGSSLGAGGSPIGSTGGDPTGNTGGSTGGETGRETGGGPSDGTGGQAGATGGTASGGSTVGIGGDAAGGAATGGAPAEPELITSGPNAYWNTEGKATEVASGTADLSVDETTAYQRWDGFGGTFNEMGWDALSVVSSEISRALTLLFDAHEGANFAFGRIPIGASDYAMSWYTLAETAGDYSMEKFSIARDREMLIPYIKAALELKPDLRLWGSPWVVPDWMKDSGGAMKSDAQTLEAHALYLAKFVEEYGKEGLTIEAVHPQNEPGYASVRWSQSVLIDYFKTYLGPKFAERNLTAEIWCGTMSAPADADIATAVASDPESMKYVKGFGLQWNLQSTVATLAAKAPVMQTEHKCGNYNFTTPYWDTSRYDSNKAQNDHLYGEESWQLIRDWIIAGVNSYNAWNMVLDTQGKSLGNWPQNALLVVDRSAKTLTPTAAYYVFRHFSQYITPGATRIGTSGSNDAVAFKNPDGSVITEVYNKGDAAKAMTVGIGTALYQFEVPAHGWATLRVAS
jgi:glucosylceramidase